MPGMSSSDGVFQDTSTEYGPVASAFNPETGVLGTNKRQHYNKRDLSNVIFI